MAEINVLNNVMSMIDINTRKPEQFLSVQNEVAQDFKKSIKCLYDFTKEQSQRNTNALPELVTEGFDEEQIWQQLELQNEGELLHFIDGISKVLAGGKKLIIPISITKYEAEPENKESSTEDEESMLDEEELKSDIELKGNLKKPKNSFKIRKSKPSIVDDKFFKLQELDEYLTKEEKKEKQVGKNNESSDDESVDLFNDFSEEEDDNDGEAKLVKYTDFFDNPNSEDEEAIEKKDSVHCDNSKRGQADEESSLNNANAEDAMESDTEKQTCKSSNKKVTFNLTNDSDETDSIENKTNSVKEDTEMKSSLETRQERLQKRIHELEEEAVSEKPWQLKGEVDAGNRPQNSLLEEFVEFDITTRPPPVMTEQTTLKLEDVIKQRIKDKTWDDVEKKFKPVETPLEYKKKLILDQEKSKESLSQIYEREYLKQKEALNPENDEKEEEEPKLHTEIREMIHSLFSKLDALSNFHYTPKPAKPDIKIISNIPAINMEEVAPVTASETTLLAPEEIRAKPRGDLIGKTERSQTDMKRERRHKKIRQHEREKALEKKEKLNALKPGIQKKYHKDKASALMKKLSKDRNITKLDESSHKVTKSSTAFFNQLQDQVKSHIKSKSATQSIKKQKNAVSAVKLKL